MRADTRLVVDQLGHELGAARGEGPEPCGTSEHRVTVQVPDRPSSGSPDERHQAGRVQVPGGPRAGGRAREPWARQSSRRRLSGGKPGGKPGGGGGGFGGFGGAPGSFGKDKGRGADREPRSNEVPKVGQGWILTSDPNAGRDQRDRGRGGPPRSA